MTTSRTLLVMMMVTIFHFGSTSSAAPDTKAEANETSEASNASDSMTSMSCRDHHMVDNGYLVEVSGSLDSIRLKKLTLAGPVDLGTLNCEMLSDNPLGVAPGSPLVSCREPNVVDHGFLVTIFSPDCGGEIRARVDEQTLAGPKLAGELTCSSDASTP